MNGVFGTLCVGLFATDGGLFLGGGFAKTMTQLIGIAAVGAVTFALSLAAWYLLKATVGIRVSPEEEAEGLDLGEHGMEAYAGMMPSRQEMSAEVIEFAASGPASAGALSSSFSDFGGDYVSATTICSRGVTLVVSAALGAVMLSAGTAQAQATDPNPGPRHSLAPLTCRPDMFRGIRQETDPGFTMWPAADPKIDLMSGDGTLKSAAINLGLWNSLHTGSSGSGNDDPAVGMHYEEDFYASFTLGSAGRPVSPRIHRVHESECEVHDGQGSPVQGLTGQQVRTVWADCL